MHQARHLCPRSTNFAAIQVGKRSWLTAQAMAVDSCVRSRRVARYLDGSRQSMTRGIQLDVGNGVVGDLQPVMQRLPNLSLLAPCCVETLHVLESLLPQEPYGLKHMPRLVLERPLLFQQMQ